MKFLDLVPSWVYAAAVALLLTACGWLYIAKVQAQGELADYRAEVAENTRKAEAQARAQEQQMQRQVERISDEQAKKQTVLAARAATANLVAGQLRDQIERLNARPAPADPESAAFAGEARAARELLGACAERYRSVATEAEGLVDQVTGLQDFAINVCKAPAGGAK